MALAPKVISRLGTPDKCNCAVRKGRCGVDAGSIYSQQCVGGGVGETIERWWWLSESNRNVQKLKREEEENVFRGG